MPRFTFATVLRLALVSLVAIGAMACFDFAQFDVRLPDGASVDAGALD